MCAYSELIEHCLPEVKQLKRAHTERRGGRSDRLVNLLGEKIRKLRKEKGFTLERLADLTESSKSYIWELENKNPPRPSAEKIARIAEKLDTTIEFLLDEGEGVSKEDAADARFYRQYRKMDAPTKEKIRLMVKLWGETG